MVVLAGVVLLVNNRPYCEYRFDQYHGDMGSMPYQNYIDYVNHRGGLTFWAHLEAENISERDGIRFETKEHSHEMVGTKGYTGFAIFHEGYRKVGRPGGVWDSTLRDYCLGLREKPVWAIAGLASEGEPDMAVRIRNVRTILMVPDRSRKAVLEALRSGMIYVARGPGASNFVLDGFSVSNESGTATAVSGGVSE